MTILTEKNEGERASESYHTDTFPPNTDTHITHRLVEWRPLHLEDLIAVTNKGVQRCLHVAHVPQHHHLMGRAKAQKYQTSVRHMCATRTHQGLTFDDPVTSKNSL